MMGTRAAPERLFYDFCLEDHVPSDHLLRRIDRFLDLSDVRKTLRPFYCTIGRPSIDPELMIRMLIVGYCLGIRSERRLCEEVHLNLAYSWFCRLRDVFETVVRRCMAEGLVGGEGFAVDASLIDVARSLSGKPAFEQSRRDRKRVEMLFAHLKRILKLGRLRLRGPRGAQDEFLLAATAQNLRKLAKLRSETPPAMQLA
jgi:transposase